MRKSQSLLITVLVILASACVIDALAALTSTDHAMPGAFQEFLVKKIRLTQQDMQSVFNGRQVAKLLETKTKDEIAILGIVKIHAPQELFIEQFRDIVEFERGAGVHAAALFHSPPTLDDVAALTIDADDLKEISRCKHGDCEVKLSDRAMQILREQVDWKSPQAGAQAQSLIRQAFVDYVARYQKIGDEALFVYNDKDKPQAIRDGLNTLLQNAYDLFQYDPQLAAYLRKYPQEKPPDTEDIFYWQKGEFGLKPVIRASHVVIHRNQHGSYCTYAIASKMLLATHYFRAALELKSVVPDSPTPDAKSFYLVCLNRSFVDGLTGFKGMLIRGTVKSKSRQSLEQYLAGVKNETESAYKTQ